jgi:hypothetical protein
VHSRSPTSAPLPEATSEQKANVLVAESAQREGERTRRRGVEPLDVVHPENDGPIRCEQPNGGANRHGERARIRRVPSGSLHEERDLERASLRSRQLGQNVLENVFEQISQPGVSEPTLGLGRPRRKDAQSPLAGRLDACEPERRLPDARLALEHECRRPSRRSVEEGVECVEFLLPADDARTRVCPGFRFEFHCFQTVRRGRP